MTKYRNKPTEMDGIVFHSKREAMRYANLRLLEKAGEIAGLELQVPYPLFVNGMKIATYVADFRYRRDRATVVEDSKGARTRDYIIKKKLMAAIYDIEILET